MKRCISFFLSIMATANSILFLVACSNKPVNFVYTSPKATKSLDYLKNNYSSFDSTLMLSTIEGLFHSAPLDQQNTNEVLEMNKVNDLRGLIVKEMIINTPDLDFSGNISNIEVANSRIKSLAQTSTQVVDGDVREYWYGVAKDIFVLNYDNNINNAASRVRKEFIIRLRSGPASNKNLPYNENGVERWQDRPALWHDGVNVKAQDFVNSVQFVLDQKNGSVNTNSLILDENLAIANAAQYLNKTATANDLGIKAIGDDLLYLSLRTGFVNARGMLSSLISKILSTPAMLPSRKDILEKYGSSFGASQNAFLGNGAYKIYSSNFDQDTILIKNQDYWDRERITADSWKFKVVVDPITNAILFESGEGVIANIPLELLPRFTANQRLRPFVFQGMSATPSVFLGANYSKPYFQGEQGRYLKNAIQYVIDRNDILISRNDAGGIPGDTLSTLASGPSNSNVNGDDLIFRETIVTEKGEPKYFVDVRGENNNEDRVPLAYYGREQRVFFDSIQANIDRTDRLKKISVAKKFYNDFRKLNPSDLTLNILYEFSNNVENTLLLIKQTIENNFPGIKINLVVQTKSVYQSMFDAGEYDLVYTSTGGSGAPITINNPDTFSYLSPLSKEYIENGTTRYIRNPTGNWTFYEFIKRFSNLQTLKNHNSFFRDFNVTQEEFLWLHALFTPYDKDQNNFAVDGLSKNDTNNFDQFAKLNSFLQTNLQQPNINILASLFDKYSGFKYPDAVNNYSISGLGTNFAPHISFRIYAILEAIIKLESPVIMLSNGESGWAARRIIGYSQGTGAEVQYGYNCQKPNTSSIFPLKSCSAFAKPDLLG